MTKNSPAATTPAKSNWANIYIGVIGFTVLVVSLLYLFSQYYTN